MTEFAEINQILAVTAVCLSVGTGIFAVLRDPRSLPHRLFAAGMIALASETLLNMFCREAALASQAVAWLGWSYTASAFIPVIWILFSFTYARLNYRESLSEWKWFIVAFAAVPILLALAARAHLFGDAIRVHGAGERIFTLGWSGIALNIVTLLSSVFILANLEKTLRTSHGLIRWQIKYLLLGISSIFASRIYISAQNLLYSTIDTQFYAVGDSILIAADILIILFAARSKQRVVNIYVSQDLLQSSLTILVVGAYLLSVGIIAKAATYLGVSEFLIINALTIFIALLGSTVLVLSSHVRYLIRKFIHHHLHRPYYDYRKIWNGFSEKTSSIVDLYQLCGAVAKTISRTFLSSAATIWIWDEDLKKPVLCGSTVLSLDSPYSAQTEQELHLLMDAMRSRQEPVDLTTGEHDRFGVSEQLIEEAKIRYCARMSAGGEFIGILVLNTPAEQPFSIEDFELMKIFAGQTALLILKNKLFESLGQAKEMQAFQTLSAFFVHDLKNIASTLSLTLQNLPIHYDKPEFRRDAQKMILSSREKIQSMCNQLSLLNQKFDLQKCESDLNEIVGCTLANLNLNCEMVTDIKPVPKAFFDSTQIEKVVLNLVLNASESAADQGKIRVETGRDGENLVFTVTDNGCGMSADFIKKNLFRPFMTTKDYGSGIGLYQSKMIVEAHGGKIEVTSREGFGSIFRVLLPIGYDKG